MKKFITYGVCVLLCLSACNKLSDEVDVVSRVTKSVESGEIVLSLDTREIRTRFTVETKTTAVTSLPSSLYWGATTGSGSETAKWSSASGSVSSSKISTGKYQTASATTYNYYVSNVNMSVGANTTVSATGGTSGTDVICGRVSSSSTTPSVTLTHIFARTGSLSIVGMPDGITVSSSTWYIKTKGSNTGSAGTYNLRTGAWSSTSGVASWTTINNSTDMYLIPGAYTVRCDFTDSNGNSYSQSGDVTLVAGKTMNIQATPTDIIVGPPTFGGLELAPCNTFWDGSKYTIPYDDWKHITGTKAGSPYASDYGVQGNYLYGNRTGSCFFEYQRELAIKFDSRGSSYNCNTGPIDHLGTLVSYDGHDDWRIPTLDELYNTIIRGVGRTGSTVNGISGIKFCLVRITNYALCPGYSKTFGILVFPDNRVMSGATLIHYNDTWLDGAATAYTQEEYACEMTLAQLDAYCDKGCRYIPDAGSMGAGTSVDMTYGFCVYWCLDFYSTGNNAKANQILIVNRNGSIQTNSGDTYEYINTTNASVRGNYNLLRLIRTAD